MKTTDAINEIKYYEIINKIDKLKQFYLGVPKLCKTPNNSEENIKEISECNIKDLNDKSILIMKYGGIDLWKYGQEMKDKTLPINNLPLFWVEFHRIIKGVELFLNNGYLHYDIKPDNIVYNENENRINFIDFGLMRKKRDIYDKGVINGHYVSYHTTYSLEHFFYNKINYEKILLGSQEDKMRFINNFKKLIINESTDKQLQKIHQSMLSLFKWIKNKTLISRLLKDYEEFIMLEREPDGFLNFIILSVNKFDIYGVGLTIIYLLNHMRHLFLSSYPLFCDDMEELAYNMINPNIYKRYNIAKVDETYIKIIMKHFFVNVVNIKYIIKSHSFDNKIKGGNKSGRKYEKLNIKITNRRNIKSNNFITRKKFNLKNMDIHLKISKIRSKKYRFVKNKMRSKRNI